MIGCRTVYGNLGGPFIITAHYEFLHLASIHVKNSYISELYGRILTRMSFLLLFSALFIISSIIDDQLCKKIIFFLFHSYFFPSNFIIIKDQLILFFLEDEIEK